MFRSLFFSLYASEACAPFFHSLRRSRSRAVTRPNTFSLSLSPKHRHCLAMLIFCSDRGAQFLSFIDNQRATGRHFSSSLPNEHLLACSNRFLAFKEDIAVYKSADLESREVGFIFKEALVLFENKAMYKEKHSLQTLPDHAMIY